MENKILKTLLSVIVIFLAGFGIFFTLTTEIPVLTDTLNVGNIIQASQIGEMRVFKSAVNNETVIRDIELVGKKILVEIQPNAPIFYSQVGTVTTTQETKTEQIGQDMTILSIKVNTGNAPGDLKAGDLVNILAYFSGGAAGQGSFITGYNTIYKINKVNADKETGALNSVDLIVPKAEAVSVQVASTMGQIYLIKNSNNNSINLGTMNIADVYARNVYGTMNATGQSEEQNAAAPDENIEVSEDNRTLCESAENTVYDLTYTLGEGEEWYGGIEYCRLNKKSDENEFKRDSNANISGTIE